jgi:hypothetical protein
MPILVTRIFSVVESVLLQLVVVLLGEVSCSD